MPVTFDFSDAPYERANNSTGELTYGFDLDGMTFTVSVGPAGTIEVGGLVDSQNHLTIFAGAYLTSYNLLRWRTEDGATQLTGDIELKTDNNWFQFVLSTGERVSHTDGRYSGENVIGAAFLKGAKIVSLSADGIAPPRDLPDLAVTALSVDTQEIIAGSGEDVTVSYIVENVGSQDIGPSKTQIYESPFQYLSRLNFPLAEIDTPALKAGESISGSVTVALDDYARETYLFARADSRGQYAERIEDNNFAGSIPITVAAAPPPGPDLVVQNLQVAVPTLTYGGPLSVSFDVKNRGDTAAPDSAATVYISYSNGTSWFSAVPLFTVPSVGALGPGDISAQTSPVGFTLDLDAIGLAPGIYRIVAVADSDGAVAEFSEANNTASVEVVLDAPVIAPPVATQGPDVLIGTPYRDFLDLLGGDDSFTALGGNDFAEGGPGNDTIHAGLGDDRVFGGSGFDSLHGGAGADSLDGGPNADVLKGEAGNDRLVAGDGLDIVLGGPGEDVIFGGTEADRLRGDGGFDTIWGGAGDDSINGGDQADDLYGEAGNDTIFGGGGVDWLSGGTQEDSLFGGDLSDTLYGDAGFDWLEGGDDDDLLSGGAQADNLFGGSGADKLYGGWGFDRLFGGTQGDLLYGGIGPDGLFGEAGEDTLFGEFGADRLFGGVDDDLLDGGAQADTLYGGDGDDTLTGGLGDDLLFGETGGDVFAFADGHGSDTIADFYSLNAFERIDLSAVSALGSAVEVLGPGGAASDGADGVLIATGVGTSILLESVTLADLQPEDFLF